MKKQLAISLIATALIVCISIILIKNYSKNRINTSGGYIEMSEKTKDDFQIDLVYHSPSGRNIHYYAYIPESIDIYEKVKMYITLPGWEGLYFQGVGANLKDEEYFKSYNVSDQHSGGLLSAHEESIMNWLLED